jgi:pimeloyl-ACP methyl ester carboxylesterase
MNFQLWLIRVSFFIEGRLRPGTALQRAIRLFSQPRQLPYKQWEQTALKSALRGSMSNGMSYLHYQTPQRKLRILALHGWEGRATHWQKLAEFLKNDGVEIYAVEPTAHGETAGRSAGPQVFKNALLQAQQEFGEFDYVVGHSMGAGAIVMALNSGLKAKKAVFIAGPATFTDVMWRFCKNIYLPKKLWPIFGAKIANLSSLSEADVDIEYLGSNLTIPGLIIHDREDRLIPFTDATRVAANWKSSEILITENLGHMKVLRDQQTLEKIRDFLLTN